MAAVVERILEGLDEDLALRVATQLTAHDALGAHAEAELGIDPDELTSAWHAAWASMLSFTLGALLPLLTILLVVADLRVGGWHAPYLRWHRAEISEFFAEAASCDLC